MAEKKKGKFSRGSIIALIIALAAFTIVGNIYTAGVRNGTIDPNANSVDKNANKRSDLAEIMDLTEDQEAAVLSIFEQCGVGELSSVKLFHEGDDRSSYYVDDTDTARYRGADYTIVVWVDNASKTVQEIYFHDETIYADSEVKAQITDYYVSYEASENYRVSAELLIEKCLNYPDTAKYPSRSGWRFGVIDGLDVAQSTVTAQNAFGVSEKIEFTIRFERSTGTAVSLVLGGQEYIAK